MKNVAKRHDKELQQKANQLHPIAAADFIKKSLIKDAMSLHSYKDFSKHY